jgi:hypothetical protein
MKTNFMLAALVIVIICSDQSIAQGQVSLPASTAKTFTEEFAQATNVRWERPSSNIFMARFDNQEDHCLAYLDDKGQLITKGRLIVWHNSPVLMQRGVEKIKSSYEKKYGPIRITHLFEMVQSGATQYYVNMGNDNFYLALITDSRGNADIIKKQILKPLVLAPKSDLTVSNK